MSKTALEVATKFLQGWDVIEDVTTDYTIMRMFETLDAAGFVIVPKPAQELKYVSYDYEEPGAPDNYWHIFSIDGDGDALTSDGSLVTIVGPNTDDMRQAVVAICNAIEAAVDIAKAAKARS